MSDIIPGPSPVVIIDPLPVPVEPVDPAPVVDPIDFAAARAEWLHSLNGECLAALHAFRRYARMTYPDADNASAAAWDAWNIGGVVPGWDAGRIEMLLNKMPREFVVSLDRGV